MSIENDRILIETLGGATQLANRLKLVGKNPVQRVHNWTKRGIPPAVKLQYPHLLLPNWAESVGSQSPKLTEAAAA